MGLAASRQEAFWEACGFGHVARARKFLEQGDIDVNWVSYVNDCSPIHVASQGKPDIVQLLLEYKCDVNVKDNRGNLAIHHAAMAGHSEIVQTLIEAGSEIDTQEKNGWTALHNASYWCHPSVVQMLIKKGCDVNIQNKDERTALHEVARSPSSSDDKLGEIAKMLIDAGSDINAKSSDRGEADLTGLMYAAYHNHPEVAQAFIDAGCELDAVGSAFWTALHWAADRGHDELVYILVDAGANPLKKNMGGEIAAQKAKSDEIRDVLLNAANMYRELHYMNQPLITLLPQPIAKPIEPYVPKCDAHFKSESFLPKDWKPSSNLQKLKELRERLREQHLKSIKNTSPIKIISHDTEQGPSKGKESDNKHRESSIDPDSPASSEDSDAVATDSDASSMTDSVDELISEATIVDDVSNIEKLGVNKEENNIVDESQGQEVFDQGDETIDHEISKHDEHNTDIVKKELEVEVSDVIEGECVCDSKDSVDLQAESKNVKNDEESVGEANKEDQEKTDEKQLCQTADEIAHEDRHEIEKSELKVTDNAKDLASGFSEEAVENLSTGTDINETRKVV